MEDLNPVQQLQGLKSTSLLVSQKPSYMNQCMHIDGLIPLMSTRDHPTISLFSLSTFSNFSSSMLEREDDMMMGSVAASPR